MIPLGILAASGVGGVAGDFVHLETQTLSGNQSSITFSGLGAYWGIYSHLQVRFSYRQTANDVMLLTRINGVTGGYSNHQLFGNGAGVGSSYRTASNAGCVLYSQDYASTPANAFFVGVIDILDAFSTTKNKTLRTLAGGTGTGTEQNKIYLTSTANSNTDALQSFALSLGTGATPSWETQSFTQFSRFSLYGVK